MSSYLTWGPNQTRPPLHRRPQQSRNCVPFLIISSPEVSKSRERTTATAEGAVNAGILMYKSQQQGLTFVVPRLQLKIRMLFTFFIMCLSYMYILTVKCVPCMGRERYVSGQPGFWQTVNTSFPIWWQSVAVSDVKTVKIIFVN